MTTEERQALEALRDPPTNPPNIAEDSDDFNLGDIWDGTDALPISHAGGEFRDLARGVLGEVWKLKDQDGAHRVQRVDNRTRRDRVLRRNLAFNEQIQIMSESYLIWSLEKSQKGFKSFYDCLRSKETEVTDLNGGQWPVTVVDAFFAEKFVLKISSTDHTIASALVLVSDRYLSRNFVEQFARDTPCDTGANSESGRELMRRPVEKYGRCKDKKAWGIYDETGVFVAVCRHGFCLLITDMVQSGEQYSNSAKYPLAIVAKLLDAFGNDLGSGYDIGCIGIKDLETCERTFSKSNSLASALRYTSVFHRQQAIDSYFEHNNELEVYGNLSNFLHGNYKQALEIIANGEAVLPKVMQELKVEDESVFECWLEDEKIYLKGLTREPEEETLQMEYWQRLVNLSASNMRRHALEDYERNLKLVQLLECKLGIIARWVPEDEEWQKAGRLVANRKYQRALDRLEGLVVAHIFELAKMNRAGTGYKLREHIARALQTRSAAIRSALNTYNNLASVVYPPRQILKWEDVVEYAFLADFELLQKTRSNVSQLPWSSPAARMTYIRDEDKYLQVCEDRLTVANPALAHQIAIHRNIRGRFNSRHIKRLDDISKLPGFNGTLVPGLSACTGIRESASVPDPLIPANVFAAHIPAHNPSSPIGADTQEDLDEEEITEEVAEEASRSLQDIITITADFSQLQVVDNGEVEE
ncbi:hypothetical protein DFJ58DRAFT_840305 [Suillus subalutaceus]|uniref:uncharacterized protein n=1 Tax=Suillus subalutaceus TaxID=48586 RepID=UPI001B87BA77|nr:uncharacterized protein DFJ58DRAFT_840305 [Suillus subalutaceus]KAG1859026.1 hypothetical protein DFJ58DRAFT_840305 [Suillus subalutaceus]